MTDKDLEIQELRKEIETLKANAPRKWISVKDGMPTEFLTAAFDMSGYVSDNVLVYMARKDRAGHIGIACTINGKWSYGFPKSYGETVTHWMHLPAAPA